MPQLVATSMINMLPTVLRPLLPCVWGVIAVLLWGRSSANPMLFGISATLAAFGVQAIAGFLLDKARFFQAGIAGNPTAEDIARMLERENQAAWLLAGVVLVVIVPFTIWLRSGFLSRVQR